MTRAALSAREVTPPSLASAPRAVDLDALSIASPCSVPWETMTGDDRVRFCGACQLHVFDVRAMTRPEAIELIDSRLGTHERTCLRLTRRRDGTLVTREDCTALARLRRRARWIAMCAAGALALLIGLLVGNRLGHSLARRIPMGTPPTEPLPGWDWMPSWAAMNEEHAIAGDMDK